MYISLNLGSKSTPHQCFAGLFFGLLNRVTETLIKGPENIGSNSMLIMPEMSNTVSIIKL